MTRVKAVRFVDLTDAQLADALARTLVMLNDHTEEFGIHNGPPWPAIIEAIRRLSTRKGKQR